MKETLRRERRLDVSFEHFMNVTDCSKCVTILIMQNVLFEGRQKQKATKAGSQVRNVCLDNLESLLYYRIHLIFSHYVPFQAHGLLILCKRIIVTYRGSLVCLLPSVMG